MLNRSSNRILLLFLIVKWMLQNKLQQLYILVRFPLVIVPVINLFPLGSKYILYCLLFENADGPFKYFSFDSRHDIKLELPRWLSGKESASQCRRCKKLWVQSPGRSPGLWNGNPLQYFCLENPTGRKAWQATVHGVAKRQKQLSMRAWQLHLGSRAQWGDIAEGKGSPSWLRCAPWARSCSSQAFQCLSPRLQAALPASGSGSTTASPRPGSYGIGSFSNTRLLWYTQLPWCPTPAALGFCSERKFVATRG